MYTARYAKKVLPGRVGTRDPAVFFGTLESQHDPMFGQEVSAAPVTAEQLAPAARAQAALPGGHGVRRCGAVWDHRLPGIWGVTVEPDGAGPQRVLRVADGRVAVPAGLPRPRASCASWARSTGGPWDGGLIYIVTAAGGATPGFPDSLDAPRRRRGRTAACA